LAGTPKLKADRGERTSSNWQFSFVNEMHRFLQVELDAGPVCVPSASNMLMRQVIFAKILLWA
jgi:hypothetical protein